MIEEKAYAAIVGVGQTRFGELFDRSLTGLVLEAGLTAIKNAKIKRDDIDAMFVGSFIPAILNNQGLIGAKLAEELGVDIPIYRCESACSSGGDAITLAVQGVMAGLYDIVVAGGVEKMAEGDPVNALKAAASETERVHGNTFTSLYAQITRRHMHLYGTTREQLAMVASKNHRHAKDNPYAHFRNQVTPEQILKGSFVAEPLTLFDCSPISDGGAAAIIVSPKLAKNFKDPVYITGFGKGSASLNLAARKNIAEIPSTKIAVKRAFEMRNKRLPKKTISDINLAEVHDCFTIEELLAMEDLGFCKKGEAGKIVEKSFKKHEGDSHVIYHTPKGDVLFNPGGGLKAAGHPVGATGIRQLVELVDQMRGTSGHPAPVKSKMALSHNIGGTGGNAVVTLYEVE